MLDALTHAAFKIFTPETMLAIFAGNIIGILVGILPGLGGSTTIALLLPFIWKSPPDIALPLLVSLHAVVYTGGSITSILLNIPGETTSAATLVDGYPMNRKGEGARAIGAALISSMAGGVIAVPMALVMIPLIVPVIMTFKSPELLFMVILGISFIAVLSSGSAFKGLISAGVGMMMSLIGMHVVTGISRFTFGSVYLYNGLNVPVVVMGLFGLSEMMELVMTGQTTISKVTIGKMSFRDVFQGGVDVIRHGWLWFRSSVIGYIVGIIPGIGPGTAVWIAYGHAKQSSKHAEKFGTGYVGGVIAPEAANNASTAGALLTTMAFGIPGSVGTAVLLGGFLLVGLTPGPVMMTENLDLSLTLLLGVAVANVMAGIICLAGSGPLARIAFIHMDFLYPVVIAIIFVAAFVTAGYMQDVLLVIVMGLLGLLMNLYGYSKPALALGFIMGQLFEYYFFRAILTQGYLFFLTPTCMVIVLIMIGLFSYPHVKKIFR